MMYNPYNWKINKKKPKKECILEQICQIANEIELKKYEKNKKRKEMSKTLNEYNHEILKLEHKKTQLINMLHQ